MPNHLNNEKSPYLLQHADNPVEWYPWCEEAFRKAKETDKPIFLSIGYSTCHWCHVMAHESFEDDKIAELLNENFISIKVDREERPEIDAVYMAVCQTMTGQGGWPLSIFMTPEKIPFFAATYLPPRPRFGMASFPELLEKIAIAWKENRAQLTETADNIRKYFQKEQAAAANWAAPEKAYIQKTYEQLCASFDSKYGGFGSAPKFPSPHHLLFLFRYGEKENEETAKQIAEKTLVSMYRGGIFDHIGGGFSRYSTDEKWLVPHFEKMLYDNAMLVMAYCEAYLLTGKELYRRIVESTLEYVSRELTDPEGGFYCGQDADSEGQEGKYYVFSEEELKEVLGADAELFCSRFGVTKKGNFEGKNILNLLNCRDYETEPDTIGKCRAKLQDYRKSRMRLHKDDKVLTSWNALMITAYAKAYMAFHKEEYLKAAQRAEMFIADKLTKDGRLLVRYRDGEAKGKGNLDDYAFYCMALLELYRGTFRISYLEKALQMAENMRKMFFDEKQGGFYLSACDSEQLIFRPKEVYDGAIPSGNSVAALVLRKLAVLTEEEEWQKLYDLQMRFLCGTAADYPMGYTFTMLVLLNDLYPSSKLVCVKPDSLEEIKKLAAKDPSIAVLVKTEENQMRLSKAAPFTESYNIHETPVYYLCRETYCLPPFSSVKKLMEEIERK